MFHENGQKICITRVTWKYTDLKILTSSTIYQKFSTACILGKKLWLIEKLPKNWWHWLVWERFLLGHLFAWTFYKNIFQNLNRLMTVNSSLFNIRIQSKIALICVKSNNITWSAAIKVKIQHDTCIPSFQRNSFWHLRKILGLKWLKHSWIKALIVVRDHFSDQHFFFWKNRLTPGASLAHFWAKP